jgi:hypothetical protein
MRIRGKDKREDRREDGSGEEDAKGRGDGHFLNVQPVSEMLKERKTAFWIVASASVVIIVNE